MNDLATATAHATGMAEAASALANRVCVQANALPVTNDQECQFAVSLGAALGDQIKVFEKEREPMRQIKRTADKDMKRWTPAINAMKDSVTGLRNKIEAYRSSKRVEYTAALTEATSQQEVQAAVAVLAPAPQGLQEREDWDIEIVDERLIPREYWIRDDAKLRAVARAAKDAFNVPGVRAVRRAAPVFKR